jgi:hypothetical protein
MPTGSVTVLQDARVYAAGLDLSGQANQVGMGATVAMNDVTSFDSGGWTETRPGLKSGRLDVTTYLDESLVGTTLEAGAQDLVVSVADDDEFGSYGLAMSSVAATVGEEGAVGEVLRQPINFVGSGAMFQGRLMLPKAARTVAGNGTELVLGQVAAGQRVYASLHVFAATGGTVTAIVESAAATGMAGATTRITFAAASTPSAQLLSSATTTTNTFWRVRWTQTATSATFAVVVGIQ